MTIYKFCNYYSYLFFIFHVFAIILSFFTITLSTVEKAEYKDIHSSFFIPKNAFLISSLFSVRRYHMSIEQPIFIPARLSQAFAPVDHSHFHCFVV